MQEKKKYCINTVLLSKLNLIILFNPLYEILDRIECSQYLNRRVKREGYHITWYVHQTVTQNKLRRREGKQVRFENDVKFATAIDRSKCLIPNRTTNFTLRAHLFLRYHLLLVPWWYYYLQTRTTRPVACIGEGKQGNTPSLPPYAYQGFASPLPLGNWQKNVLYTPLSDCLKIYRKFVLHLLKYRSMV